MSNIYIQEPPTNGKVLLVTSVGDIDIELWSKETPRACRNFIQLCMEGYYNDTIFHRIIKGFIVQGGDPTGTGLGGDSIYGKPFKDEFHSRLRFNRRGLVAMANSGVHDNSSQFFFTLSAAPELSGKHTLFAKVVGDTIYNMLKLEDVETGPEDRPLYPPKIIKTQILSNPFDDIVPRVRKEEGTGESQDTSVPSSQSKATKNFSLLSFGSDAEEEEEESLKLAKDIKVKSKSSHDLINDPKLSSVTAMAEMSTDVVPNITAVTTQVSEGVRGPDADESGSRDNELTRTEELNKEAKRLKRELQQSKKPKADVTEAIEPALEASDAGEDNELIKQYKSDRLKYKLAKKDMKSAGNRESQTLLMLRKFQEKLAAVKAVSEASEKVDEGDEEEKDEDEFNHSWFSHKLNFASGTPSQVIDANIYETDRYDIQDPRNPLNKRKRDAGADSHKPAPKSRR